MQHTVELHKKPPRLISVQIVLTAGLYLGPGFYQIFIVHRALQDSCMLGIWQLLHKVNVALNNCFRKKYIECLLARVPNHFYVVILYNLFPISEQICLYCLQWTKFGQLNLGKVIKIVDTSCQI